MKDLLDPILYLELDFSAEFQIWVCMTSDGEYTYDFLCMGWEM